MSYFVKLCDDILGIRWVSFELRAFQLSATKVWTCLQGKVSSFVKQKSLLDMICRTKKATAIRRIMGPSWGRPWNPSDHYSTIVFRGLSWLSIGLQWCKEMALIADVVLPKLADFLCAIASMLFFSTIFLVCNDQGYSRPRGFIAIEGPPSNPMGISVAWSRGVKGSA